MRADGRPMIKSVRLMYDPIDEVNCRYRLAINYLREANEAFSRGGDWRGTIAAAQLSAENAAKAVIAVYRIPSRSHDPSSELGGDIWLTYRGI